MCSRWFAAPIADICLRLNWSIRAPSSGRACRGGGQRDALPAGRAAAGVDQRAVGRGVLDHEALDRAEENAPLRAARSEERRGGTECVRKCRVGGWPYA